VNATLAASLLKRHNCFLFDLDGTHDRSCAGLHWVDAVRLPPTARVGRPLGRKTRPPYGDLAESTSGVGFRPPGVANRQNWSNPRQQGI